MHARLLLLALCAAVCLGQDSGLPPEVLLLSQIKVKMAETLRTQPNYTCVQQIERSRRRVPKHRYELLDHLRLEVALVDGKELFAWPGSKKFEDTELHEMVTGGAIGNGNFALHARAVFLSSAPLFTFRGEETTAGRKAYRFDYKVSLPMSGYHIRVNGSEAVVAYHGSFWADLDTLDVMRLEVVAEDIPPALGLEAAHDVMDYARAKIGGSDFLLPSASELSMTDLAGNESRNHTQFVSCRQYTGESVLSFGEPEAENTVQGSVEPATGGDLPGELYAEIQLESEIDSATSMVGDPVTAVLQRPVRSKGRMLLPQGATLSGRIIRLQKIGDECVLDVHFTEAQAKGWRWNLFAHIAEISLPSFSFSTPDRFDRNIEPKPKPEVGTMYMRGGRIHLTRGVRILLRTEDMAAVRESHSAPL